MKGYPPLIAGRITPGSKPISGRPSILSLVGAKNFSPPPGKGAPSRIPGMTDRRSRPVSRSVWKIEARMEVSLHLKPDMSQIFRGLSRGPSAHQPSPETPKLQKSGSFAERGPL